MPRTRKKKRRPREEHRFIFFEGARKNPRLCPAVGTRPHAPVPCGEMICSFCLPSRERAVSFADYAIAMQTQESVSLRDRILSLEYRVRNFEYAKKWFQDLRSNADEFEVAQYDEAIARNQDAIDTLRAELRVTRQLASKRRSHWPAPVKVAV
jgi:hypothetical protein